MFIVIKVTNLEVFHQADALGLLLQTHVTVFLVIDMTEYSESGKTKKKMLQKITVKFLFSTHFFLYCENL